MSTNNNNNKRTLENAMKEEEDEDVDMLGLARKKKAVFYDTRNRAIIYKSHPLIDLAYEYSKGLFGDGIEIPVFACDKPNSARKGAKTFPVASYDEFWKRYKALHPKRRNHYETVLEGIGCHIHIDAEYNKTNNKDADEAWLDTHFKLECTQLLIDLGYIKSVDDLTILTLVSSSVTKVSKHYIIKMSGNGGVYFKNNYHVGAFVRRLQNRLLETYGPVANNPFFLWSEKSQDTTKYVAGVSIKQCYIDMGIYTKGRQFRLYYSTKLVGEYRPLLTLEEHAKTNNNTIPIDTIPSIYLNESTFYNYLIQRVPPTWKPCECLEVDGSEPKSTSDIYLFRPDHGDILAGRKENNKRKKFGNNGGSTLTKIVSVNNHKGGGGNELNFTSKGFTAVENGNNGGDDHHQYHSSSLSIQLLPMIQDHIKDDRPATPKSYFHLGENLYILYSSTSHACEIKGKNTKAGYLPHNGNCIYFIASVRERVYWQKCFGRNPPCRQDARGKRHPFPNSYVKIVEAHEKALSEIYKEPHVIDSFFAMFDPTKNINRPDYQPQQQREK